MTNYSRRNFLQHSSMAFAASALGGAASTFAASDNKPVSANDKILIGAIGCGGMGRGDIDTFLHNAEVECPIICDIDDKMTAEAARLIEGRRGRAPEIVKDFRRVIDRKDLDAVLVATPDHWHALPTVYACQAGKDVYCEKPLGKTIDEGRAMVEAAKDNKRVVQMGTQWRSGEHYQEAIAFIHSGNLGKVRMVRTWAYLDWLGGIGTPPDSDPPEGVDYDMWLGPAPARPFNPNRFHFNFRWFWDYAGGLMTDWGVHLLNVCQWGMGYEMPKVAVLGAVEMVNENMEATLDAALLSKMNQRDQIRNCIIDGPLAFDNAVSLESAKHKGIRSEIAGDTDLLLMPDIEVGNVLYKSLVFFAKAKVASVILGARVPIVLTSRSDSEQAKYDSILLSAAASK